MEFIISRTSFWNNQQPCKEAYTRALTYQDWRTQKTIEEAKTKFWFNDWFKLGKNHREEKGMIVCDRIEKSNVWCIEINTLEELMSLQEKHGDLIISSAVDDYKEIQNKIEIYDDYRE